MIPVYNANARIIGYVAPMLCGDNGEPGEIYNAQRQKIGQVLDREDMRDAQGRSTGFRRCEVMHWRGSRVKRLKGIPKLC